MSIFYFNYLFFIIFNFLTFLAKGWRHDRYNEPEEKNIRGSPKYGSD